MAQSVSLPSISPVKTFRRETLIKGQPAQVSCVEINGQTFSISKGSLAILSLEENEWFEDVTDPELVIRTMTGGSGAKADLFTFLQRLPDTTPKHPYYQEWDSIAVLSIEGYDHWWNKKVKGTTRNMIRKSQKAGVAVRECAYDDDFVRGMVDIFNEAPIRQGRRFWHYGKDFATVKSQFSRFLFREQMIGAYYENELIGFVMLGNAGTYGVLGQIISKIKHRDKAVNNALIAKAVEVCCAKGLRSLVYGFWDDSSLVDFKRHSGFEEVKLPRYYVPLSQKGKLAIKTGLHRGLKTVIPDQIKNPLKRVRRFLYGLRSK